MNIDPNYDNDKAATSLIEKFLYDMSIICGESVVMRGIKFFLISHDKIITNVSSFTSD